MKYMLFQREYMGSLYIVKKYYIVTFYNFHNIYYDEMLYYKKNVSNPKCNTCGYNIKW